MTFEYIKNSENKYVQDIERNVVLQKNGGGAGFKSFKFTTNDLAYDVVVETSSLGGVNELWTIKGVCNNDCKDKKQPVELYDLILETINVYKRFVYKDMHDTIKISLDDRLVKLKKEALS